MPEIQDYHYQDSLKDNPKEKARRLLTKFGSRKLGGFVLTLLLVITLPITLVALQQRQTIKQQAAAPDGDDIPIWNTLVLIYKDTDITFTIDGNQKRLTTTMSDASLQDAVETVKRLPGSLQEWSGGYAKTRQTIVYPDHPIQRISSLGGNNYWYSYSDAKPDLDKYAPAGTYDSIIVIWKADAESTYVPSYGWGLSVGPGPWANGAGYTTVTLPAREQKFSGTYPDEIFIHEWIHQATDYYQKKGYAMPNIDASSLYGYNVGAEGSWKTFLSDTIQGKVWNGTQLIGITPVIWKSGNPTYNPPVVTPFLQPSPTLGYPTPTLIPTRTPTPTPFPTPTPTLTPIPVQTFRDVTIGSFGYIELEKFVKRRAKDGSSIGGCTGPNGSGKPAFCPNIVVNRGEMSKFMIVAMQQSVSTSNSTFTDVTTTNGWGGMIKYIMRMKELSITTGCGNGTIYCPGDPVTRGAMVTFIGRALPDYASYRPPTTPSFTDVSASAGELYKAVEFAKVKGITQGMPGGCSGSGNTFCPGVQVTRIQMAIFLMRAWPMP